MVIIISQVSEFISKNFKHTICCKKNDAGNLIGLPYPYTTPCAGECFIEMYYWDTYFINVGLLATGNIEQAKYNARIKTLVFGAYDKAMGSIDSVINLCDYPYGFKPEIYGGIMEDECAAVIKNFFEKIRGKNTSL